MKRSTGKEREKVLGGGGGAVQMNEKRKGVYCEQKTEGTVVSGEAQGYHAIFTEVYRIFDTGHGGSGSGENERK